MQRTSSSRRQRRYDLKRGRFCLKESFDEIKNVDWKILGNSSARTNRLVALWPTIGGEIEIIDEQLNVALSQRLLCAREQRVAANKILLRLKIAFNTQEKIARRNSH